MPAMRPEILTRNPGISLPFIYLINWVYIFFSLTKGKLSLGVSFTASLGYILFAGEITPGVLLCLAGVFFLSGGCGGLNHVQEAKADARMERTARRPIPSGRINAQTGLFLSLISLLLGLVILQQMSYQKIAVLMLAVLAPLWYNGVYTYAKKITRFAVLIGAPLGALGPMIGWCAAGGALTDPTILLIGIFCILWQIPHFFLILLARSNEYEQAGFKTWNRSLAPRQFQRIIFVWIMATVAAGLFLGLRHPIPMPWNLLLLMSTAAIGVKAASLLYPIRPSLSPRDPMLYGVVVLVLLCLS